MNTQIKYIYQDQENMFKEDATQLAHLNPVIERQNCQYGTEEMAYKGPLKLY